MTHALNQKNGGLGNIGGWIIGQLIMPALALVWVWVAGLRFLWRSGRPLWKALAWAYGLLFVFFMLTTGAKIYYLAGRVRLPAGRGCGGHRRVAGGAPVPAVPISCWPPRSAPLVAAAARAAGAARRRHRLDLRGEPCNGRVHRLAAARRHRPQGLGLPAAPSAGQRGDLHRPTTVRPAPSTSWAGAPACPPRSAGTTPTGGGDRATRAPPRWSPSRPGPPTSPATPPTCGSSSPACGWRPRCPTRTASTTRNGAATYTCAPGPGTRGPRCGPGCATTTDSGPRQSLIHGSGEETGLSRPASQVRASRCAISRPPGNKAGYRCNESDASAPDR